MLSRARPVMSNRCRVLSGFRETKAAWPQPGGLHPRPGRPKLPKDPGVRKASHTCSLRGWVS